MRINKITVAQSSRRPAISASTSTILFSTRFNSSVSAFDPLAATDRVDDARLAVEQSLPFLTESLQLVAERVLSPGCFFSRGLGRVY